MPLLRALAVSAALVIVAAPAGAQQEPPPNGRVAGARIVRRPPATTSDSVPRELVLALLQGSDGLRVGEPAGDLPREVLPPNGVVLGSVEYSGTGTTLVVLMQPEHEAIAAHEERAKAAGWTPPPPSPYAETFGDRYARGFVPSALGMEMRVGMGPMGPMGMGRGTTRVTAAAPLCRGDAMLMATSAPWSGGRTLLRLQSMNATEYSPCRPRTSTARSAMLVQHVTVYDSIIPALQPPARAQVRPGGSSSGSDEWEVEAAIETALPVAELVAHYAAELRREGWTPIGDAAVTSSAAVQLWRKTATDGRPWRATITFAGSPDTRQYEGTLRLQREGAR